MAEPIRPVSGDVIKNFIQKLDKKAPENNTSIFMQQQPEESRIDNDFIFKQLYT